MLALQAVLISPHFLFRIEEEPSAADAAGFRKLNDFEVATRLSYFLWSSMPDDQLLELAAAGKLRDPDELSRQVKRMLEDPKSQAFVENFGGQWLTLRTLEELKPDPDLFPSFTPELRDAMLQETKAAVLMKRF